jgi:hypothetical protein
MAGRSLQVSDRSAFFQLTINNSTYVTNNLYFDGTNWRYIVTGAASLMVVDSTGATGFYKAVSGTAGALATLTANIYVDGTTANNLLFNSGYGSSAIAYGCRAWVNFNGTGTVAIRASGNVSSITDGGVGVYTVNFTSAFPDINYCPTAVVGASGQLAQIWDGASTKTTSAYLFNTMFANSLTGGGGVVDPVNVQIAIFR